MALQRAIQGATRTPVVITWARSDSTVQNLTGATLSGAIEGPNGETRAIAGDLDITDAEAGEFTWTYDEDDLDTPGDHIVQFTATFDDGPDLTFSETWRVDGKLTVS